MLNRSCLISYFICDLCFVIIYIKQCDKEYGYRMIFLGRNFNFTLNTKNLYKKLFKNLKNLEPFSLFELMTCSVLVACRLVSHMVLCWS